MDTQERVLIEISVIHQFTGYYELEDSTTHDIRLALCKNDVIYSFVDYNIMDGIVYPVTTIEDEPIISFIIKYCVYRK